MILFNVSLLIGQAVVFSQNGKYGIKNATGQITIAPKYERAYLSNEAPGIIITEMGGKKDFVGKSGDETVIPKYDVIAKFQNS